jgi:hypothetical protein
MQVMPLYAIIFSGAITVFSRKLPEEYEQFIDGYDVCSKSLIFALE